MRPVKLGRDLKRGNIGAGFGIEILHPGLALNSDDSGIGAIGRIDQARIPPGGFIRMHPHKDDEILTYVRSGRMLHRDTVGDSEEVHKTRLMLMNAGRSFQHEEKMLGSENIEALQIFLRPHAADLEPRVQFHDFDAAYSLNAWRMIAGPTGDAPLEVRARSWVQDARLERGMSLDLPTAESGHVRMLYVFSGAIEVAEMALSEGEALLIGTEPVSLRAEAQSDLVLFTTDPDAPVFRGGMFSGNVRAA